MRSSRVLIVAVLITACSGDTFLAPTGGSGGSDTAAAGTGGSDTTAAGTGGSEAAGSAGETGGTAAGEGGSAAGGSDAAGAAGTSSVGGNDNGGAAGVAGAGGAACPKLAPGVPTNASKCGNGIVEDKETCDDGNQTNDDGCSGVCVFECGPEKLAVDGHCYSVQGPSILPESLYDGPTMVDQPEDLVRPKWETDPCGVTSPAAHLLLLDTVGEQSALQKAAMTAAAATFQLKIPLIGAFMGVGARFRSDLPINNPDTTWRNGEGGKPIGFWEPGNPAALGGRCAVLNRSSRLENVVCFATAPSLPRPVICEAEPSCALVDGDGRAHVGYVGPNNHCYARFAAEPTDKPVEREAARTACESAGAHLAAFESIAELEKLTGANLTSGGVWLAARRHPCRDDAYTWETDGMAVNLGGGFWDDSEPAVGGGGCVVMRRNRQMAAADCAGKAHVLCERDYLRACPRCALADHPALPPGPLGFPARRGNPGPTPTYAQPTLRPCLRAARPRGRCWRRYTYSKACC